MIKIPGVWGGHGHPKYRTIPHTDSPKSPKPGSFLVSFNNPLASQVRQGTCLVLSTILSLRLTTQSHTNWQFYNIYNFHGDYSIMIRKWMSSSTLCAPWLSSSLTAFSQGESWFTSNTFVDILKKPKWNQQQVKQHLRADDKRTNRRTSQDWRHPWRRGWGRRWWPELDGGGGKISNDDDHAWWQCTMCTLFHWLLCIKKLKSKNHFPMDKNR